METYVKYCATAKYKIGEARDKCEREGKHLATVNTDSDLYHAAKAQCIGDYCPEDGYWIGLNYSKSHETFYNFYDEGGIPIRTAHQTNGCGSDEKLCVYIIIKTGNYIEKIVCVECNTEQPCVICKNESAPETREYHCYILIYSDVFQNMFVSMFV